MKLYSMLKAYSNMIGDNNLTMLIPELAFFCSSW